VIRRLEHDHLSAHLAAVEELLSSAPPGDVLGRMSLTERRDEVRKALAEVESRREMKGAPHSSSAARQSSGARVSTPTSLLRRSASIRT
jgi:hypothetical protein